MSQFDKFKRKKDVKVDEEPVHVDSKPVYTPEIKKPEISLPKTTKHKDKEFKTNRTLDKNQLIAKMFETIQVHIKLIPIETLRSSLLHYDLLAHRNQVKK